jgi:hypothetical protein
MKTVICFLRISLKLDYFSNILVAANSNPTLSSKENHVFSHIE